MATFYLCLITALCVPSVFATIPGGWSKRDPKEEHIQEVAAFGVKTYNEKSNFINNVILITVKSAESQIVAGTKYRIKAEIGETDCRKNYSESEGYAQMCDPKKSAVNKVSTCTFTIVERLWEEQPNTELLDCSCSP